MQPTSFTYKRRTSLHHSTFKLKQLELVEPCSDYQNQAGLQPPFSIQAAEV